jgi:hypothetical protein
MTPERAQHILRTRDAWGGIRYGFAGPGGATVHADGMTRDERQFVVRVWHGMPGHTAFIDALARVARGEVPAVVPAVAPSRHESAGVRQSDCRHEWAPCDLAGYSHWCQRCLLPGVETNPRP